MLLFLLTGESGRPGESGDNGVPGAKGKSYCQG